MGCPPRTTSPREDCRSSGNPLLGKLFLVDTPQGCHICIIVPGSPRYFKRTMKLKYLSSFCMLKGHLNMSTHKRNDEIICLNIKYMQNTHKFVDLQCLAM